MNTGLATKRRFIIVLGCLTGIGAVTIDMSLPSIPGMVQDFSATIGVGQQIIGVFMIGIALGQRMNVLLDQIQESCSLGVIRL